MNAIRLTGCILASLATLLTLTPATTAFAGPIRMPDKARPPKFESFHFDLDEVLVACDGFDVRVAGVEDVRVITFFDDGGNPVSVQIYDFAIATLTNSVTGVSARFAGQDQIFVDLLKGTESFVGLVIRINIPGQGVLVVDAGKVTFDADGNVTFEGGPHDFLHGGEAVICAALSGPAPKISSPVVGDRGSAPTPTKAISWGRLKIRYR